MPFLVCSAPTGWRPPWPRSGPRPPRAPGRLCHPLRCFRPCFARCSLGCPLRATASGAPFRFEGFLYPIVMSSSGSSPDPYVEDIDCACLLRPCGRLALLLRARGLQAWRDVLRGSLMCAVTLEHRWLFVAYPPAGDSSDPVVLGRTARPLSSAFDSIFALLSLQARGDVFARDMLLPRSVGTVDHYLVGFADHSRARVYLEGLEQASLDG